MSNYNSNKRRLALKALTGSAVAGGLIDKLPATWQHPLVKVSSLPVHAQSSPEMEETGQVQLTVNNQFAQSEANLPLTYMIDRNSNGQITHIRIPPGTSTALPSVMDALLPAAYAQSNGNFVVQREFVIDFANRLSAAANLVFGLQILGQTITCTLRITAYLTQSRRELARLMADPAQCDGGNFVARPITGPNSDFSNNPSPATPTPAAVPDTDLRIEWSWYDEQRGGSRPRPGSGYPGFNFVVNGEFRSRKTSFENNIMTQDDIYYHQVTLRLDGMVSVVFEFEMQEFAWDITTNSFIIDKERGTSPDRFPFFKAPRTPQIFPNGSGIGGELLFFHSPETFNYSSAERVGGGWWLWYNEDGGPYTHDVTNFSDTPLRFGDAAPIIMPSESTVLPILTPPPPIPTTSA